MYEVLGGVGTILGDRFSGTLEVSKMVTRLNNTGDRTKRNVGGKAESFEFD